MPSGLPNSRGAITLGIAPLLAGSGEPDVFEVDRLAVDATRGRGDPVGELTPLVQGRERGMLAHPQGLPVQLRDGIGRVLQPVVVVLLGLFEAPLQAHRVEVRGVRRDLGAEKVERDRVVEVEVLLERRQVDRAVLPHVVGPPVAHQLARALHDTPHAGLAHEHVVGLLGQHEPAGSRQRVEAALGEARELVLAVAVREVREHEVGEPVERLLVEGAEDARLVRVARPPLERRLRLLAAVPTEVGVEEVHHRPEVSALLDVDLEEVAQVVERGAGAPEVALLLDRGGLGVALRDDEPPQHAAVLTRDVLPDRLALVVAEGNDARGLGLGEEDPPAVLGHADVAELRPALRIHAHRGAQIDLRRLEPVRAHVLPLRDELRLPLLEGALQAAILAEADVVRDPLRVVDRRHHTLLRSNSLRWPVPYTTSAPFGPTAFARWKIQFCHADSRPKILVSSVSGPPNRSDASMPVSASGEKAARASSACRTSSSQSMSSGVKVTRSEEHTSELQSRLHLVCRLLLEKKKDTPIHWVRS